MEKMTVLKILEQWELGHYSIPLDVYYISLHSSLPCLIVCSCYPGLSVLELGSAALDGTTPLLVVVDV